MRVLLCVFAFVLVVEMASGKRKIRQTKLVTAVGLLKKSGSVAIQADSAEFTSFKDKLSKKLNVDKKLLDIDGVKQWYQKEIVKGKKKLDLNNTVQMASVSASLGNIWCAYCQQVLNCPCIKRWCAVSSC